MMWSADKGADRNAAVSGYCARKRRMLPRAAAPSVDQLQDIVSEYGMDPGRVVAKWKSSERIAETVVARAQKGNAFRSES
jgi:hypothetical protein